MNQKGFSQVILLGIIAVFVLVGAGGFSVLREKKISSSEKIVPQEVSRQKTEGELQLPKTRPQNTEATWLGNFCSSEKECISFCLNNRGRCETYCKGNYKNKLCTIIFTPIIPVISENKKVENKSQEVVKENCAHDPKPVFKISFTDITKISSVSQIGSNALYNPGAQARSYINMKLEIADANMVPIYAPVDSVLTGIAYAIRNLRSGAKGEYRLDFQVSCEVRYAFDHLADIVGKIKKLAPKVPANNTRSNNSFSVPIHAGELVGYTDRNIIDGNWDFVFINTAHESPHANPSRWFSDHSNHADCPYDYFIPELKERYYELIEKSDSDTVSCGPIVRDISGSIAGYWFMGNANEDHGKRFGIFEGTHFVEFILANEKEFFFIRDNNPSRIAFSEVNVGKSTCYFDNEKNNYAYLKLLSEREVGLVTGNGNCPSVFPNEFEVYLR